MEMLQRLQERYKQYEVDVRKAYQEAAPLAGLFGWGDDPKKDPCHMRFYEDVEQWVGEFLRTGPDGAPAYEAARFILGAAAGREGEPVFWFLYAAHGLCRELIPLIAPEGCAALRELYDSSYPRRDRMPVQKDIYKLLCKYAGKR